MKVQKYTIWKKKKYLKRNFTFLLTNGLEENGSDGINKIKNIATNVIAFLIEVISISTGLSKNSNHFTHSTICIGGRSKTFSDRLVMFSLLKEHPRKVVT